MTLCFSNVGACFAVQQEGSTDITLASALLTPADTPCASVLLLTSRLLLQTVAASARSLTASC
jgi:hypothetical protein